MPAPQRIKELVENFKANFKHVQSPDYREEDLRNHFLNPFFQELGWDMEDRAGKGPMRDVYYEKTIKSGAPDYGFYTDGKRRFFVEAKNPSVNVCTSQTAALQLRGYGWSAKVPLSILTDFEELSIYDTTVKPKPSDQARVARIGGTCIKYTEFVERWDEIAAIFSREAVIAGSLEKFEGMHANQTVDKELLVDISRWREMFAKNIANRNQVSEERLNRIVQDTIGRILFLRICEDRGIAHEGDLSAVAEGDGAYAKLFKLFKKAEQRYDSDLFEVDSIADLVIDDDVLKEVISALYFPKSQYKFDAIPAEILGQVYEQFLGKVIRLTEGGHAKVEEKPEVRKSGGIYYTPTFVVEYIVRNTIGKLVEGKTPKEIKTLSIVDPACGSGSFLLGAYKFLANWYRDWYVEDDAIKHEKAKKIYRDAAQQWQLMPEERKRILIAHIYGVDLDRQAVELAKLSLMLEALGAPEQQSLMLPRLGKNIKSGNSLIGTDYFVSQPTPDSVEMARINAFDWEIEFDDVFKRGGFDVVIGNPPWGADLDSQMRKYLNRRFPEVADFETAQYFTLKALELSHRVVGFILPNTISLNVHAKEFRKSVLSKKSASELIDLSEVDIFLGPGVRSLIIILGLGDKCNVSKAERSNNILSFRLQREIDQGDLRGLETWKRLFSKPDAKSALVDRLLSICKPLAEYCEVRQGYIPYRTTTLVKRFGEIKAKQILKGRLWHSNKKESVEYQKELQGGDVGRYELNWSGVWVKYGPWISTFLPLDIFSGPRVLIREITSKYPKALVATYTDETYVHNPSVLAVLPKDVYPAPKFILGVLCSKLMSVIFLEVAPKGKKGLFPKIIITDAKRLPFPEIDLHNPKLRESYKNIIEWVDQTLALNKQLSTTESLSEKTAFERQIAAADQQIDQLVYKLYGLTEEEVRAVEGLDV